MGRYLDRGCEAVRPIQAVHKNGCDDIEAMPLSFYVR